MNVVTNNPCCDYAHFYLGTRYRFTFLDGTVVEDIYETVLYEGMLFGEDKSDKKEGYFEINNFRTDGNFQLFLWEQYRCKGEINRACRKLVRKYRAEEDRWFGWDTLTALELCLKESIDIFDLIRNGHALDAALL